VFSFLHNDVLVERGTDHVWTRDTTFTSDSKLREQIAAGYFSTKWLTGNWQITAGLRYETYHHNHYHTNAQEINGQEVW
jgi:outer membrane receptor for Fe3+-dicitrate